MFFIHVAFDQLVTPQTAYLKKKLLKIGSIQITKLKKKILIIFIETGTPGNLEAK